VGFCSFRSLQCRDDRRPFAASITVVTFTGADATGNGAGAIGNSASASAASGAASASLITTRNGSWVFGVGTDWDHNLSRTPASGQTLVHQYLATVQDTYWVQEQNSPTPLSGTQVFINDTSPTTDRYDLTIAEVLPATSSGGTVYNITGSITPATSGAGATVVLSGAASASTVADANGNYSFTGLANGSYTVTPGKAGFTFSPANQPVTVSGANQTANFTAQALVSSWSISGTIGGTGCSGCSFVQSTRSSQAGHMDWPTLLNVKAGDALVYFGEFTNWTPGATVNMTDSHGNTWYRCDNNATSDFVEIQDQTTNGMSCQYTLNTAAWPTISAQPVASQCVNISCTQVGGAFFELALPATATARAWATPNAGVSTSGSNNVNCGSITLTEANDFLMCDFNNATGTPTAGTTPVPFTMRETVVTAIETGLYSGSGTITPTGTLNPSGIPYTGITVAFGLATGGAGTTVTLSGSSSATTVADANGNYSFTGLANGPYTVTPSKTGYSFAPANQPVMINGANQTGVNFTPQAANSWVISGTISPSTSGSSATVVLSGASSATVTADASGNYSFPAVPNGAYTVTPSKTGFNFTPASQSVTVNGVSQTANFAAAPQTWAISGTITPASNGAGSQVSLTQGSTTIGTATANGSGSYSFTGLVNGTYTVTPTAIGMVFTPASLTVIVSGGNQAANFTAAPPTWTVSGSITPATSGASSTVTLTQGSTTIATAIANASGSYTFSGVLNGAYTVAPAKSGVIFTPASQSISVSGANVSGVNFSAAAQTWTIQGTILGGSGAAVTLTQGSTIITTAIADANGNYSLSGVGNGTYTVTPAKSGYSFTPASQSVTVSGARVTGISFTAAALATYTISGNIANGSGASVTLSGSSSTSTTADGSGNFSFAGLSNGSYTVAASKSGFSISPVSQAVTVNNSDRPGINFTAIAGLTIDAVAYRDTTSASTTATTSAFSTASANELLLAFIASDAKSTGMTVTGVSGGALTWTLVRRTNTQMGTAEVWRAFASGQLSNVTVTATLAQSVISSITVVTFIGSDTSGTNGSGAIGATASGSAGSGAATASLVTTRNGSWVLGVGNDFNNPIARTLGANQTMVHQSLSTSGDTYWVQRENSTTLLSGTSVTLNDTAPTGDPFNLTVVEVLPPAGAYSISGSLSALGSAATVALSGAAGLVTTADGSGNYSFSGLNNGSYTVTPGKGGVSFTPPSQSAVLNGNSATAVNFTASLQTWSLSGNLSPASNGTGASLTLGGVSSSTATADASGNYTFSGLTNGMYSVTPSKSGYTFSPTAQSAPINNANVAGVNFTVSVAPPPSVVVSISPTSASLLTGGSQQFSATVTGTTNSAVTWSATAGTISSSGRYTAPGMAGIYIVKATSVADTTKSASATVNVAIAGSSTLLLGDQSVESQADAALPLGNAEAFQTGAIASGSVQSLTLYLDPTSTVSQVVAGLYADAGGHPGNLLNQGTSTQVVSGAWNSISLPATSVVAGAQYWIAIMGTNSGTLVFREATSGSCASESSAQTSLTALPSTWATGNATSTCPVSAFGDGANVIFFDNFPGTTLSSNWTVIARHGEYSQNETECNIPQQVTVANGLTITAAAQTWTCGDFHPDGTVWHTPTAWPYITGDIQWKSFNFTHGTVVIQATFPAHATTLWPATWLLTATCQSTNPFTAESGSGCPYIGGPGYGEIDMTECFGSTWCQFHVANPDFALGNGCDATYNNVDTNVHTFKTVWNASGITQYVDGVALSTCGQTMNNPMFLIIQIQTGGNGGTPNNALLPASLVVNYVKVTQP
jgi:Glycosyl hydrolases family 16